MGLGAKKMLRASCELKPYRPTPLNILYPRLMREHLDNHPGRFSFHVFIGIGQTFYAFLGFNVWSFLAAAVISSTIVGNIVNNVNNNNNNNNNNDNQVTFEGFT